MVLFYTVEQQTLTTFYQFFVRFCRFTGINLYIIGNNYQKGGFKMITKNNVYATATVTELIPQIILNNIIDAVNFSEKMVDNPDYLFVIKLSILNNEIQVLEIQTEQPKTNNIMYINNIQPEDMRTEKIWVIRENYYYVIMLPQEY